jgi:regulator of sirC expression with transglutaminase-like and TPR domain
MPLVPVPATPEEKELLKQAEAERFLTAQEKERKLDELEAQFKQYLKDQRERLLQEKRLLKLVLTNQGFSNSTRRTANLDKLKALATMKQLMPNFDATT